jgi:glycosyltransferase involved in cell wall biosynthesis
VIRIRALIVSCSDLTNFDGKSIRLLKYADILRDLGVETDFFVLNNYIQNQKNTIFETRITIPDYFGNVNYLPFISELWCSLLTIKFGLFLLIRILKGNYDIIITSAISPEFAQLFTIVGIKLLRKGKHIYDYDDLAPEMSMVAKKWNKNHPLIKIQFIFEKFICSNSFKVITMSESMKNIVIRSAKSSIIQTIYNLPYKNEVIAIPIMKAREKLNFEKDKFIFCYIGNVQGIIRSLETVVHAVTVLSKENVQFKILIIGTGPGIPLIQDQIRQYNLSKFFLFSGPIERDAVIDYGNASNVSLILLPESMLGDYMAPGKLFISMGLGKNIIATDNKEVKHILKEHAIYVNPNPDYHELANAMKIAISKYGLTEINENLIVQFQEKYNWDVGNKIFREIISEALKTND